MQPEDEYDEIADYLPEEDALYEALENYMNAMCVVEDAHAASKYISVFVRKNLAVLVKERE